MKDYASVEQKVCPVCGMAHDVGVLLDRQLRKVLERHTVTGWELCQEHARQQEDGYVFLIEIDPARTEMPPQLETAYRTGVVFAMQKEDAGRVFNIPVAPIMFIDQAATAKLRSLQAEPESEGSGND